MMNPKAPRLIVLAVLALAAGVAGWLAIAAAPASSVRRSAAAPASLRFDAAGRGAAAGRAAPLALTASDGTGLDLVSLEAVGVLEGPLAFTELRLSFRNPRPETIEGRFRVTLPPGAVLSRFAMKIGSHWQEGEVVERRRARRIYEDFLHRRQDPALLEQQAGNEFAARVFPIPAGGVKDLVVSYSHALASSREPYVIPLLGLPQIERLEVRVLLGDRPAASAPASSLGGTASDRRMIELAKTRWTPDRDFEVSRADADSAGLRHDNLVVARVAPAVETAPQEIAGLFVLVDSSASRALGYEAQVDLVARLLEALSRGAGESTPVGVAAFDQTVTPIYEGPAGGFGGRHLERLLDRRALGASDLAGALGWLAARMRGEQRYPRLVVVTDGVATAGASAGAELAAAVAALAPAGVERCDVLALGGLRDEAALRQLVTGSLAHDGQVIDGSAPSEEIARRLTRATRSGIEVAVEGARWVWPEVLDGVQDGDEVLVWADLPAGKQLRLALGGRPVDLGGRLLEATQRPLLERAWVKSRIDRLLFLRATRFAGDADLSRALVSEITQLSLDHRVMSPFTAFLVLETDNDYRRYGLDRTALADILTVGPGGLEVVNRTPPLGSAPWSQVTRRAPPPPPPPQPLDAFVAEPERALHVEPDAELQDVDSFGPDDLDVELPATDAVFAIPEPRPRAEIPRPRARRVPIADPEPVAEAMTVTVAPNGSSVPEEDSKERRVAPLAGRFAEVRDLLEAGRHREARELAESWSAEAPGDVLALLALGEACEATGDTDRAARAYGSLIDLFPSRADLRRHAGERLERLARGAGLALAIDTYEKARAERGDHPSSHRQLAWALVESGRLPEAFAVLEGALGGTYRRGSFRGVDRILREDLGLVAAAWLRAEPSRRGEVRARLDELGVRLDEKPSLRFVLTWETDANDVDLHVYDAKGGHAYFSEPRLASGGELYADVTTGYGPECFTVPGPAKGRAHPYRLQAHYYRRGPMGYGMGTLQIVDHDGHGGLEIETRPFVVMADGAFVDLGTVE